MGGIGKTWLATKLAENVQHQFKSVVWRSLRSITRSYSPIPFSDFLDDLIRHLTPQSNPTTPEPIGAKMWQLMDTLRRIPCLLVLVDTPRSKGAGILHSSTKLAQPGLPQVE